MKKFLLFFCLLMFVSFFRNILPREVTVGDIFSKINIINHSILYSPSIYISNESLLKLKSQKMIRSKVRPRDYVEYKFIFEALNPGKAKIKIGDNEEDIVILPR